MMNYKNTILYLLLIVAGSNSYSQWKSIGPYFGSIIDFAAANGKLVSFTQKGEYVTLDKGENWRNVSDMICNTITANGNTFYAGSKNLYQSDDYGNTWTINSSFPATQEMNSIIVNGNNIVIPVKGEGVCISTDKGFTWKVPSYSSIVKEAEVASINGHDIFVAAGLGVYKSTDYGITWEFKGNGISQSSYYDIAMIDSTILLATLKDVFISSNYGESWSVINSNPIIDSIRSFTINNGKIYAVNVNGQLLKSVDKGKNWTQLQSLKNVSPCRIISDASGLYYGTKGNGIFVTTDEGKTWNSLYHGINTANINAIGVTDSSIYVAMPDKGVFVTNDDGFSWDSMNQSLSNYNITSFACKNKYVFAGTSGSGVERYNIITKKWQSSNTGLTDLNINALAITNKNNLIAGSSTNVFVADTSGNNWTVLGNIASNLKLSVSVSSIALRDSVIIIGTSNAGILRSNNYGKTWALSSSGITGSNIKYVTATKYCFFAATDAGLYGSNDYGVNWKKICSTVIKVSSLAAISNTLFIGTINNGFIYYNDPQLLPDKFFYENDGFKSSYVNCVAVNNSTLFATTYNDGLFVRPVTDFVTSVHSNKGNTPCGYLLSQNYPNPFNPSTTITFSVPKETHVTLRIYDILGREITTLVNEKLQAGSYSKVWNATGYSSGEIGRAHV